MDAYVIHSKFISELCRRSPTSCDGDDVHKIITGNLSRCLKKEPDTITTGVTSRKREKKYFYQKLFMNTET